MHAQERTLGIPKIEEIKNKFPTNSAYQSKKEQTEWYVTNTIKTNAGTWAYYKHSGIIAGIAEKFPTNDAYQTDRESRLNSTKQNS